MSIFGSTGNHLPSSKAASVDYAGESLLVTITIVTSVYHTHYTGGIMYVSYTLGVYELILCLNAIHESGPRHCGKTSQLLSVPLS